MFRAEYIKSIKRTPTVESFRFTSHRQLDFKPGQFVKVVFDKDNLNDKELNKYLSFSSCPDKNYFEVTKRLSKSKFSQRLKSLKEKDILFFQGPMGQCIFEDDFEKIGFLIGGIGITPVISILEYIDDKRLSTDAVLLYSNREEEEIAFKEKLDKVKQDNRVNVVYTVTDCKPQDKECEFGRIDKGLIADNLPDIRNRIIYIFGPPKMVEAMEDNCKEMGADEDNIRKESFIGY